jgi:hypothetical protein
MECIDLSGLGLDLSGGSNSPLPSSSNEGTQGVCGRMCEMGGDTCPSGEVCILGFCTPECEPGDPTACGNGLECSVTLGVCAPPGIDSAGDDAPPMTDDGAATDTGADTGTTGGA